MEEISGYISKARSLGQTDDQIKQAFLKRGWTLAMLNPYFPTTAIPDNWNIKFSRRFLFLLIIICLTVAGVLAVLAVSHINKPGAGLNLSDKHTAPKIEPKKVSDNVSDSNSGLLAYVRYNNNPLDMKNREAEVKFFDLYKNTLLPADSLLSAEKKALPSLGIWSPDGKYLPIIFVHPASETSPLFFFDSITKKSKNIYNFQPAEDIKYHGFITTFWFENGWIDNSLLVFYRDTITKRDFTITNEGIISEKNAENDYTLQNSKMTVTVEIASGSANIKSLYIENIKFPGSIKGQVIGLIKDEVLSLESPAIPNILNFTNDPEFSEVSKKVDSAKSEEEKIKLIDQAMKPKGAWLLHFYNVKSGIETNSHKINNEGWIVKNVQIRPKKNTILMALEDKALPPYSIRFVEIDPSSMKYRTVGELPQKNAYPELSLSLRGDYFSLDSEGDWLISYDGQISETFGGISAWNLNNGNKIIICEKLCADFRIFNPEVLTRK